MARLRIFPFKSLPGVDVATAVLTSAGGFLHDREFAMFDDTGYVNGKREAAVTRLRVSYDAAFTRANFISTLNGSQFSFGFEDDFAELERWLAAHFGRPIVVKRECDGGFPDDGAAPGPTIISVATLAAVASWFPELTVDGMRVRLRTNIEVANVPAFWEDQLFAAAGTAVPFQVGEVRLAGTNPSTRCIVPARDPDTGSPLAGFAKRVAERRAATLPQWADATRFDHFYRLAVNTRTPEQAQRAIRVGDRVVVGALDGDILGRES